MTATPDPRAAQTYVNFLRVLSGIQALGQAGFENMLDTATQEQMTELHHASEVLLGHLYRMGVQI